MTSIEVRATPYESTSSPSSSPSSSSERVQYCSNEVTFVGKRNLTPSKYIKVPGDKGAQDTLIKEMSSYSDSGKAGSFLPPKPEVLISVTGGAQDFYMHSTKLEQVFNRGILKAAHNSSAWIVDGGLDAGVMQHLGKAIQEMSYKDVPCIGIAAHKMVIMNELLDGNNKSQPVEYVANIPNGPTKCALNSNHTHFILVDSHKAIWGEEIDFRSNFEEHFRDKFKIPVLLIAVNGGPVTIDIIAKAAEKKFAIVVVQGSGRASDAVAAFVKKAQIAQKARETKKGQEAQEAQEAPETQKSRKGKEVANANSYDIALLMKQDDGVDTSAWINLLKEAKGDEGKENKYTAHMNKLLANYQAVTIFNADDEASADMDIFILRAILSSPGSKLSLVEKLIFGVKWDRADVIAEILETELPKGWQERGSNEGGITFESVLEKREALNAAFQLSIELNRPKIFKILAENGAQKESIDLKKLYTHKLTDPYFKHLPCDWSNAKDLCTTTPSAHNAGREKKDHLASHDKTNSKELLRQVFGNAGKIFEEYFSHFEAKFNVREIHADKGFTDILIWAVLVNRMDFAKVVWQHTTLPMHCALLSCKLYRYLSNHYSIKDEYLTNALWFENEAVKMMNIFPNYSEISDIDQALEWEWTEMGNYTALQIAQEAQCKKFICHPHVQSWLDDEFYSDNYGKVDPTTATLRIWLSIAVPVFVYTIYIGKNIEGPTRNQGKKILHFYRLPIVKFWTNTFFYCCFLFVQAWVLCTLDHNDPFHQAEFILWIWVVSLIFEECQQYKKDRVNHFKHLSNWMDVGILFLHIVYIILRWVSHEMDQIFFASINFLIIATLFSWGRLLNVFAISDTLGPLYFIIIKLFKDIFVWIFVFMIFAVSFQLGFVSITKQAKGHPLETYPDGPFPVSFFTIIGEFSYAADALKGSPLGIALLAVYALLAQIILVNLLIAMMGDTYSNMTSNSAEEWKFYRLSLMVENKSASFNPPPTNLIIVPLEKMYHWMCKRKTTGRYLPLANDDSNKNNTIGESLPHITNTENKSPTGTNNSGCEIIKQMKIVRDKVLEAENESEETSVANIIAKVQGRLHTLTNERENDRTFQTKRFKDLEETIHDLLKTNQRLLSVIEEERAKRVPQQDQQTLEAANNNVNG